MAANSSTPAHGRFGNAIGPLLGGRIDREYVRKLKRRFGADPP